MWPNPLLYDCVISRAKASVAAGTSDQDTAVYDMNGFDGILFILATGDVTNTCVLSLHAYENTASSTSSPSPTEVGSVGTGDRTCGATDTDNLVAALDVKGVSLTKRYVFCRVKRGTANAVIDGVIAIQYRARKLPITASADLVLSATI